MNENAGQFRSAALGGFHRQDVLDYLEKLTQAHQAEKDEMQAKLDAMAAEVAAAKEESAQLRAEVEELRPAAQSWDRIKSTAGDIEVAAHERAQTTIQDAQVRAAELRAESMKEVLDIQGKCDQLQADLRAALRAAEKELDAAHAAFARTEEDMDRFQKALSELVEKSGARAE